MNRETISTNNQWESKFGYARLNAIGNQIYIGGTVGINDDGSIYEPGNAGQQTTRCFEIIEDVLDKINLDRSAIVRSRIYTTDIDQSEQIGNAHKAFFNDQHPCLTLIGVDRLISDECVIEIECDAYRDESL